MTDQSKKLTQRTIRRNARSRSGGIAGHDERNTQNVYKDGTSVRAQVTSVSFFKRATGVGDLAQVRYVKAKRAAGSANEETTHWIATLQYAYADPSSNPKVRGWNPLGFKIVDFRPEPEVLTEPAAGATALATAPATEKP